MPLLLSWWLGIRWRMLSLPLPVRRRLLLLLLLVSLLLATLVVVGRSVVEECCDVHGGRERDGRLSKFTQRGDHRGDQICNLRRFPSEIDPEICLSRKTPRYQQPE